MKRLAVIIGLALMFVPIAQAIMVNETCISDTHLFVSFEYNLDVDGTNTIYKWNQTHECTNNCTDNRCIDPTEDRVIYAGLVGVAVCAFLSVVLIWLGFKFETGTAIDAQPFKRIFEAGMKMIFLVVGVFFAYSTIALGRTVMVSGASSAASLSLIDSLITSMSSIMYFFVFVIMISFFVSIIMWWAGIAKTRNYEKSSYRGKKRGR